MHTASDLILVATDVRDLGDPVGAAVFSEEWIPEGSTVAVFGGNAVTRARFATLSDRVRSRSLQVNEHVYLVPNERWSPAALINHSCAPSCRLAGEITLVAARDIRPGDQLTYDYATSDSTPYDEFDCHCGTDRCRGRVTGTDWMRPELQDRYDGWFSPYLQRMIEAARADDRDPSGGLARV